MSSKATQSGVEVAEELQKWAVNEMHFHPQGHYVNSKMPKLDDFKSICRGSTMGVWKFVVSHLRSTQTVKEVKGNLMLKGKKQKKPYKVSFKTDSKYDDEKQDLMDERARSVGEITSILTDINHLENDIKRLENEISQTEKNYESSCSSVSDLRHMTMLLQCYSGQCITDKDVCVEFSKKINSRTDRLVNRAKKVSDSEEYYSRKRSSTEEDHYSGGLETKCSRQVRKTCEAVGVFLNSMLQGHFGSDKVALQRRKDLLWSEVENVLGDSSVPQLYNALLINTEESTLALREKTANVDIRRDAERLRFKYEKSGGLKDVSNSPTVLQSVHQLIEESQCLQIKRFMDTEKHKNNTWQLEQRLTDVKEQIDNKLHFVFKNNESLKKARLYVDVEIEVAGKRAALNCLMSETDNLRENISKSLRDREVLHAKHSKIQDFKEIVDKKQNLIRVLIKQNGNARARLDEQQQEIQQYINRYMLRHHTETKLFTVGLQNFVKQEVDSFSGLSLPFLMFASVGDSVLKIAHIDMSINQTVNPASVATRQALHKVLHILNFPSYQAPEQILIKCLEEKTKTENNTKSLQNCDLMLCEFNQDVGDKDLVAVIKDLCESITEHDRKLLSRALPALQKRINAAGAALADGVQVKQTVQEWWEQPAQYTTPWVLVNKHNVQEWKDRWNVIVTKLRQYLVNKQQ